MPVSNKLSSISITPSIGSHYCCVSLVETFCFEQSVSFSFVVFPLLAVNFRICLPSECRSFVALSWLSTQLCARRANICVHPFCLVIR